MIRTAKFLVAFSLGLATTSAPASVINVQFGVNSGADSPLYVGTAAAPDNGTTWNELKGTATNFPTTLPSSTLSNSQGGTSSVTYTIGGVSAGNGINFNDVTAQLGWPADFSKTGAPNLMRSQVNAPNFQTADILLSGLNPGSTYALYLYSDRSSANGTTPNTNTTRVSVYDNANPLLAGTTLGTSNGGQFQNTGINSSSTTGFVLNEDYVLFTGLVPTTFTAANQLEIQFTSATGGFGALNGFQLVETPEPTSLVLFGLGSIGLFEVARRRRCA